MEVYEIDLEPFDGEYGLQIAGILEFIGQRLLLIENEAEQENFALDYLTQLQIDIESLDN